MKEQIVQRLYVELKEYENQFLLQESDSKQMLEEAYIRDGKVIYEDTYNEVSSYATDTEYETGMLYEDPNAFVITQKAENGKIYQGYEIYEGNKRYISGVLDQVETEDSDK